MRRLATDVHIRIDHLTVQVLDSSQLDEFKKTLARIEKKVDKIMSDVSALEQELTEVNETTTAMATTMSEVSADVDDLLAKVNANDVSGARAIADQIKAKQADLATQLTEIASRHTP